MALPIALMIGAVSCLYALLICFVAVVAVVSDKRWRRDAAMAVLPMLLRTLPRGAQLLDVLARRMRQDKGDAQALLSSPEPY